MEHSALESVFSCFSRFVLNALISVVDPRKEKINGIPRTNAELYIFTRQFECIEREDEDNKLFIWFLVCAQPVDCPKSFRTIRKFIFHVSVEC